ncbi:MAG: EamA/RhaT family transporter, partial [Rhodovulum sp.]|nr:EamA/RhaT family transporter [Rhodovulum sp.]
MSNTTDRVLLGIALMIGFSLLAPVMDAFAKASSAYVPVGETIAFRFGIQTVLLLPLVLRVTDLRRPTI